MGMSALSNSYVVSARPAAATLAPRCDEQSKTQGFQGASTDRDGACTCLTPAAAAERSRLDVW